MANQFVNSLKLKDSLFNANLASCIVEKILTQGQIVAVNLVICSVCGSCYCLLC